MSSYIKPKTMVVYADNGDGGTIYLMATDVPFVRSSTDVKAIQEAVRMREYAWEIRKPEPQPDSTVIAIFGEDTGTRDGRAYAGGPRVFFLSTEQREVVTRETVTEEVWK